ncbi:MAG: M48 family metallopeptidase [Phycisphaerales bacterium]|nr:M48 family metallopeptidase [Phycisphaerales bacterium]
MCLFAIAVALIIGIVVIPIGLFSEWNPSAMVVAGLFCVLIVGISSLVKLGQLNDGGQVVAEMLGGTELPTTNKSNSEQRVQNIVEEMAIASGMPVPTVYSIEDDSINAFAAGWTPSDAVIGVTRGCIEKLNREELQGVIAHEFSHISHGDMRINIRLIGVIFGIMAIGITGWIFVRYIGPVVLRSSSRSRSKEGAGGAAIGLGIILFGLFLVTCGSIGTFFGRLIQSAVSRQREYLADASAVQFTRNPLGIGNALRKIGGIPKHLSFSKEAGQCNHLFFTQAMRSLFASHPPINERIARVEGIDVSSLPEQHCTQPSQVAGSSHFSASVVQETMQDIGSVQQQYLDRAKQAIANIPDVLHEALLDAWSARFIVLALVVDPTQQECSSLLHRYLTVEERNKLDSIIPIVQKSGRASRLPMIDLAAPAMRQLSTNQKQNFLNLLKTIVACDGVIDRFEWVVVYVVEKHLSITPKKSKSNKLISDFPQEAGLVLSTLAYSGADNQTQAEQVYVHAASKIDMQNILIASVHDCDISRVHQALNALETLRFTEKQRFLECCETCVVHDEKISIAEAETIRAIGDALDCPIPMFGA